MRGVTQILLLHDAVAEGLVEGLAEGAGAEPSSSSASASTSAPPSAFRLAVGQPVACLVKGDDGVDEPAVHVHYLGVIDFLQAWGLGKAVAKNIKFLEPNKSTIEPRPYAARFSRMCTEKFRPEGVCGCAVGGGWRKKHTTTKSSSLLEIFWENMKSAEHYE